VNTIQNKVDLLENKFSERQERKIMYFVMAAVLGDVNYSLCEAGTHILLIIGCPYLKSPSLTYHTLPQQKCLFLIPRF